MSAAVAASGAGLAGPMLFAHTIAQIRSSIAMLTGAFDSVEVTARLDASRPPAPAEAPPDREPFATSGELAQFSSTLERLKDEQHALLRGLESLHRIASRWCERQRTQRPIQ